MSNRETLRALVVKNPYSGGGWGDKRLATWEMARARLSAAGYELTIYDTEAPGSGIRYVRQKANQWDVIIAAGGDGTVNEVASGLSLARDDGNDVAPLGILPLGTGNDIAHMMGVIQVEAALEALVQRREYSVDILKLKFRGREGQSEIRYALLHASVGLSTFALECATQRVKRWLGSKGGYYWGLLRALMTYQSPHIRVSWDGGEVEGKYFLAYAGNYELAGGQGMRLSPGAVVDDGLLDVSLVPDLSLWQALGQVPRLQNGSYVQHPRVTYFKAKRLSIEPDRTMPIQIDGDVAGRTPLEVEIIPKGIRIIGLREGT